MTNQSSTTEKPSVGQQRLVSWLCGVVSHVPPIRRRLFDAKREVASIERKLTPAEAQRLERINFLLGYGGTWWPERITDAERQRRERVAHKAMREAMRAS